MLIAGLSFGTASPAGKVDSVVSKPSRITLATEEDMERDFGSGKLLIDFPVRPPDYRPPSSAEQTPTAEPPEEDQSTGS